MMPACAQPRRRRSRLPKSSAALRRGVGTLATTTLLALAESVMMGGASAQTRALPLSELRSGIGFAGADVRGMQADDFANPGFLWVDRGQKLWNQAGDAS